MAKELTKSLALIGLTHKDVYITSVVCSRPYAVKRVFSKKENKEVVKYPNRKPTKKEVLAHAPFFDYEIVKIKPRIIVPSAVQRLNACLEEAIANTAILQLNEAEGGYIWSK